MSRPPEELPPPEPPPEGVRDAADEIVSRPEFQEPPRSLYDRFLDAVAEWLGEALEAIAGGGRGTVIALLVLAVVAAAVIYLVVRSLRTAGRGTAQEAEVAVVETRRPAAEWEAEAVACEARGDWRGALRCRYRALIATLSRAGVVEEVPGRTSGEYRAAFVAVRPAKAAPFGAATDLFERAWYGNEPAGPDESAAFRQLVGAVVVEGPSQ